MGNIIIFFEKMTSFKDLPVEFRKPVGGYIREADALDKREPRMAYFCRLYAMQQAIPLASKVPDAAAFLGSLMERLETDKSNLEQQGFDLTDSKFATSFALRVFAAADKEDRAGKANKGTARTFMAAASFFDVLQQFAALTPDLVDMRKYCKFKAAQILKAIREGKQPEIGGPMSAEEKELDALMALDSATTPLDDPTDDFPSTSSTTNNNNHNNNSTNDTKNVINDEEDDDLAALNLLSDLPTVPSKTDDDDDENDAHSNVAPPDATAPSLPPPYDQPSAVPPTDASLDIQAALAQIKAEYEAREQEQNQRMVKLHQEQEAELAELRRLAEHQSRQLTSLASNAKSSASTTHSTAPPASSSPAASGASAKLLPLEQIDTTKAMKHARFVASSLQYDDLFTALKNLKIVGKLLTGGGTLTLDEPIP